MFRCLLTETIDHAIIVPCQVVRAALELERRTSERSYRIRPEDDEAVSFHHRFPIDWVTSVLCLQVVRRFSIAVEKYHSRGVR
jgi:hypothetical protein